MTDAEAREFFPIARHRVYFNHASTGPLPEPAVKAISDFARRQAEEGEVPYQEAEAAAEETRGLLARLMRVKPEEVAFTKNTSAGIIIAAGSIDWQPGDNVVLMEDDFPTVTYPFRFLLPDIERRWCTSEQLVRDPEAVFRLVDKRTRTVVVSSVHFLTGRRFDIRAICRFCREKGVLMVIDAIQGLGVVDEDFSQVDADFVVSHGAKWLLSPQGTGFMAVRADTLSRLRRYNLGWLSARWDAFNDIFTLKPMKSGASRYEEGTKNYLGIYGMRESLKLLLALGVPEVEGRVRGLTELLRSGLEAAGFEIATPREPHRSAGIITGRNPKAESSVLHQRLTDAGIVCSLRENLLRVSPHFYNTAEEVRRFLEVLTDGWN